MALTFSGISEVRFVTPEGNRISKKDLVNVAFYWEQEAPRAREAFVIRGRVLSLNDQDTFDRREHRQLVNEVLMEPTHLRVKKGDTLAEIAHKLPATAKTGLKRSVPYAMLRSFEEDCLARFEENSPQRVQTVIVTQNGYDDVTFGKPKSS